jgi:hypothetical protein
VEHLTASDLQRISDALGVVLESSDEDELRALRMKVDRLHNFQHLIDRCLVARGFENPSERDMAEAAKDCRHVARILGIDVDALASAFK